MQIILLLGLLLVVLQLIKHTSKQVVLQAQQKNADLVKEKLAARRREDWKRKFTQE
jgi:hypothetical protein